MRTCIIDIKTVPRGEFTTVDIPEPDYTEIKASSRLKDPIKIKEDISRKTEKARTEYEIAISTGMKEQEEQFKRRSLNDKVNQIVSISVKIDSNPVQSFTVSDEVLLLHHFCEFMIGSVPDSFKGFLWLFHNGVGFDIPVLRSKLLRQSKSDSTGLIQHLLRDPFFLPEGSKYPHKFIEYKPVEQQSAPLVFDFMYHLPGTDARFVDKEGDTCTGKRLDHILKYYGLQGKVDVTGADVYDLYNDGRIDLISEYNKDEVQQMYDLAQLVLPCMWWYR